MVWIGGEVKGMDGMGWIGLDWIGGWVGEVDGGGGRWDRENRGE